MKVEELVPIVYQRQRVLTGKQVAALYNVKPSRIQDNFRKSKSHFKEGEHFFKIGGQELVTLKEQVSDTVCEMSKSPETFRSVESPLSTVCNTVILYTVQGCARHCKMLNTETAWKVFGEMETAYFGQEKTVPAQIELLPPPELEGDGSLQAELNSLKTQVALLRNQLPRAKSLDLAVVYALLMSNGSVKIGLTSNLTDRIKQIKVETGLEVFNYESTKFMSRDDARLIEQALLNEFSTFSLGGEFFSIPFVAAAKSLLNSP